MKIYLFTLKNRTSAQNNLEIFFWDFFGTNSHNFLVDTSKEWAFFVQCVWNFGKWYVNSPLETISTHSRIWLCPCQACIEIRYYKRLQNRSKKATPAFDAMKKSKVKEHNLTDAGRSGYHLCFTSDNLTDVFHLNHLLCFINNTWKNQLVSGFLI